tara:strand:+ start:620 stop:832 length:213 start_codon:yes stop_codon:yes gene_type:complete
MRNLIVEPSEYVAKYGSPYLADMIEASIEANELPMGMNIDYALEVVRLCNTEETPLSANEEKEIIDHIYG